MATGTNGVGSEVTRRSSVESLLPPIYAAAQQPTQRQPGTPGNPEVRTQARPFFFIRDLDDPVPDIPEADGYRLGYRVERATVKRLGMFLATDYRVRLTVVLEPGASPIAEVAYTLPRSFDEATEVRSSRLDDFALDLQFRDSFPAIAQVRPVSGDIVVLSLGVPATIGQSTSRPAACNCNVWPFPRDCVAVCGK